MQLIFKLGPRLLPLLVLVGGASACDGILGGRDEADVSLSFATPGSAVSASRSAVLIPITGGGHTLDVQQIEVAFSEVVLERAEGSAGGDSDGDSESDSDSEGAGNEKFRSGPVLVNLPLNGGVITPFTTALPVGFYEELEMDVEKVRIRGTYDGQTFDVAVPVDAELEMEFDPPFEAKADGAFNLTVSINVIDWFRNADGSVIDPRALSGSSTLRAQLVSRIRASFKAFEDSDRDADDADSDSDSR